jgi:hypothetical protein
MIKSARDHAHQVVLLCDGAKPLPKGGEFAGPEKFISASTSRKFHNKISEPESSETRGMKTNFRMRAPPFYLKLLLSTTIKSEKRPKICIRSGMDADHRATKEE